MSLLECNTRFLPLQIDTEYHTVLTPTACLIVPSEDDCLEDYTVHTESISGGFCLG